MNNLIVLSSVAVLAVLPLCCARSECWDTGCHPEDFWHVVKGYCRQHGTAERKRQPCTHGHAYTCCADGGGSTSSTGIMGSGMGLTKKGDMSYYKLGLTACGRVYTNKDMVAAVAFSYFTTANPNKDPMCGRRAVIRDPTTSKFIVVKVVDKCKGCKVNDIDVSPSAFEKLRSKTVGRFKVTWDFI